MIRKIIIVVLTLGAVGVLIPACLSRTTSSDGSPWCWAYGDHWKGQVAFELGHLIVYRNMSPMGIPPSWCELQALAAEVKHMTNTAQLHRWFRHQFALSFRKNILTQRSPLWMRRSAVLWCLAVPLWHLFLLFAAYPTLAFIRGPLRRYRRRKRGLCVGCGYDLRGSPGRCPECGTEIEKP